MSLMVKAVLENNASMQDAHKCRIFRLACSFCHVKSRMSIPYRRINPNHQSYNRLQDVLLANALDYAYELWDPELIDASL